MTVVCPTAQDIRFNPNWNMPIFRPKKDLADLMAALTLRGDEDRVVEALHTLRIDSTSRN